MAEQMVQVAYNAQHKVPWHWPVPAYLVTKAISAGLFLLMAVGYLLNPESFGQATLVLGGGLTVLFAALTTVLLVYDLERPERFLRIVFRPQWKSWLVRGAFLLIGFSTLAGLWWLFELGVLAEWWRPAAIDRIRAAVFVVGIPFALGAAVYTAFLFGQAEGRDLWQSTLLPVHLVVQAMMAGAAAMLVVAAFSSIGEYASQLALVVFVSSVVLNAAVTLLGEFGMPHASETAARAAKMITHGSFRSHYWGSFVVGHVGPLLLLFTGVPIAYGLAGILALAGLYLYEYAFVMAPQMVPNS